MVKINWFGSLIPPGWLASGRAFSGGWGWVWVVVVVVDGGEGKGLCSWYWLIAIYFIGHIPNYFLCLQKTFYDIFCEKISHLKKNIWYYFAQIGSGFVNFSWSEESLNHKFLKNCLRFMIPLVFRTRHLWILHLKIIKLKKIIFWQNFRTLRFFVIYFRFLGSPSGTDFGRFKWGFVNLGKYLNIINIGLLLLLRLTKFTTVIHISRTFSSEAVGGERENPRLTGYMWRK